MQVCTVLCSLDKTKVERNILPRTQLRKKVSQYSNPLIVTCTCRFWWNTWQLTLWSLMLQITVNNSGNNTWATQNRMRPSEIGPVIWVDGDDALGRIKDRNIIYTYKALNSGSPEYVKRYTCSNKHALVLLKEAILPQLNLLEAFSHTFMPVWHWFITVIYLCRIDNNQTATSAFPAVKIEYMSTCTKILKENAIKLSIINKWN